MLNKFNNNSALVFYKAHITSNKENSNEYNK